MKVLLFIAMLCVAGSMAMKGAERFQFESFKERYNKVYESKAVEEARFAVFKSNLKIAQSLNGDGETVFGVTKFMDMTPAEFGATYLMQDLEPIDLSYPGPTCSWDDSDPLPASKNWQGSQYITSVYNQEQCGSCWAFSTTEAIETKYALAGNPLTQLSMQQIVSCDPNDYGCQGGWPYTAYEYVENAGLEPYNDYPYTSGGGNSGNCQYNQGDVLVNIGGYCYPSSTANETAMASYVATTAPIGVCADASSWQYYTGGVIMSGQCGRSIDHCIMVTGYATNSNGVDYWIVRNSWGTDWGDAGYLNVERGSNVCAIANIPHTATGVN